MTPNAPTSPAPCLEIADDANPHSAVQLALLPAPVPAPFAFVEQPVQDVLRLARLVETRYAVGGVL